MAHPSVVQEQKMFAEAGDLNSLIVELDHYRRQSEKLSRINNLHSRLAGAVDLGSIIEAWSVWLMQYADHKLIAYHDLDRDNMHMFCSCHGPARRLILQQAEEIFRTSAAPGAEFVTVDDYHIWTILINSSKSSGRLLLIREGKPFAAEETRYVEEGLIILHDPLCRAAEFEDLFVQARKDTLTGLANRRVFEERIGPLLDSARRYGHSITVASMDLDNFKQINDSLGHAVGDRVLQQVAEKLAAMIRTSDLLVRMGGDEFVLVLPHTELRGAQCLAERLCAAVDGLEVESAGGGRLGVSIGLVEWLPGTTSEKWLQQADEFLYLAKAEGRSRVCAA